MFNLKAEHLLQWILIALVAGIFLILGLQVGLQFLNQDEPSVAEPTAVLMVTQDGTATAQAAEIQTLQEMVTTQAGEMQALRRMSNVQAAEVQALQEAATAQSAAIAAIQIAQDTQAPAATTLPSSTPTSTLENEPEATPTGINKASMTPAPMSITPTSGRASSPIAVPRAKVLELIYPEQGLCYDHTPTFRWEGRLYAGQKYQVHACHDSYCIHSSPLDCCTYWRGELPAEQFGAWHWTVSVLQNGSVVKTSAERMFWFNPSGCGRNNGSSLESLPGIPTPPPTVPPPPPTVQPPPTSPPTIPPPP